MRSLEEALASFPRTIPQACSEPTLIIRCAKCRKGYHGPDNCAGRQSGCKCMICHGADLISEARTAYETANTVQQLRAALGGLLAVSVQRQERARAIKRTAPVPTGQACACGCGIEIWQSPYGRPRYHVNEAHRQRARHPMPSANYAKRQQPGQANKPCPANGTR
jgi:hypothetical protein